jgi:mono/diheme cytochrome c family protein
MRDRTWLALFAMVGLVACGPRRRDQDKDPDKVESIKLGSAVTHVGSAQAAFDPSDPGVGQGWGSSATDKAHEIARGTYLVHATGCLVCHTAAGPSGPDLANLGAGGLEMPEALGTWRSPNITPDKATGIGNWTDEQIARAIREGTRPDGTQLYSIMPYALYNRMTDRDLAAVVAVVRSLKPVARVVAPNKNLKFPQLAVPVPPNHPDDKADTLKHGEYLATLMLCAHCHQTPGKDGKPDPDHMFSGGQDLTVSALGTGKLYAPNITPDADTGIGSWTEQQRFTAIKTMIRPDGRMIAPPMVMMQPGWSQLTDSDLHAVASYIHNVPAIKNKVPTSTFKLARH